MDAVLLLPPLIVAVVVHELAHAWQARREGDDTAEKLGRITLNPIPHLDLWGSVLVPLLLYVGNAGFLFGWAKPVPVDPRKFRDYRWGDIRVSLAGVVSNFVLAALFTLLAAAAVAAVPPGTEGPLGAVGFGLYRLAWFGVQINLILAVFNLIPIPPLDGSHVLAQLLPARAAVRYRALGRYGIVVLLLILFVFQDAFSLIYWPVEQLLGLSDRFVRLWI